MARVFFGLPVPDGARDRLAAWRSAVGAELPDARLIDPADLHVTLHFVGEVGDEEAGRLSGICREVAGQAAPVEATFTGLGLLPSPSRPRVVHLGVEDGAGALRALACALRLRLGASEGRRFLAHVTLARVRRVPRQASERLCRLCPPPARGTFRSLVLFQSELLAGGAAYRPLQTADLGGAA